jgi:probable F420-dependent oxidoreductase
MTRFKVGIQLRPQHCEIGEIREAWEAADRLGVDSIWTWDHFYPLFGEPDGEHYECWSMLAAMAVTTSRARFGALVTCNSYRNPDLLADMARTVDKLSGGRLILGIGSGWFERDYTEYGYEFGTAPGRLRDLKATLPRIKERLAKLNPPAPEIPLMIGGGGEKVTLRIVAEQADMWNSFGPVENFAHKNSVLNDWCAKVGRDPKAVERTVMIGPDEVDNFQAYLDAGADHIILGVDKPFDLGPTERLLGHAAD